MTSLLAYRRDIAAGARAMAPWLVGIVPFGLVIGLSAAQADVPKLAGWLTGPLIYAGSSQVATIGMLDAGAAPVVVVAAALIINIRLILYSATMARHWRGIPWWWRFVAAYLLIDPSFAVGLDLEFVIPLFLVGEAVPKLANPALRRAIFAAAAVALLALSAPLHLGTALAIAAGITAGLTARPDASAQSTHPLQRTTEARR